MLPALAPLANELDPDTYGGAVLLGVEGVCVISHGSSGARAILNAVKVAHHAAADKLVGRIEAVIALGPRVSRPSLPATLKRLLAWRFVAAGTGIQGGTGIQDGAFGRPQVLELVRGSLADILEVSPDGIAEGASFGDLGADSLALIELVEALEKDLGGRFAGFRIDDEDLEDLKTVRDAVDYVVSKIGTSS